jgi:lipopolysaccharide/colanic/teichoic acid biosynthesis glycosyltransferase
VNPSKVIDPMQARCDAPRIAPTHLDVLRWPEPPAPRRAGGWYLTLKTAAEFVIALVLLALTAPVMFLAALLVKLTSPGPAVYRQTRLGLGGRQYTILKLRTMYHDCERFTGACWSPEGDPRVTPVGRLLRATHLDELPQLFNILRGEMSLIGPRPERPEIVSRLQAVVPRYRERLAVRPGVTGLAQVQSPADTDLGTVRRKLAYDLYYIEGASFSLDVRIVLATALKMLGIPFPTIRRVFRMPTREAVEGVYQGESLQRPGSPSIQPA